MLWLTANTQDNLKMQVEWMAGELASHRKTVKPLDSLDYIVHWLSGIKNWLVILDNFDDIKG